MIRLLSGPLRVTPTVSRNVRCRSQPMSSPSAHYQPLQYKSGVKSILIVKKRRDQSVFRACTDVVNHLKSSYPQIDLFHEESDEMLPGVPPWRPNIPQNIDLILTLGGDGTILHASSLFKTGPIPPVVSFSLGTLGFLLPFHIDSFASTMEDVFHGRTTVLQRMRLICTFHDQDGTDIDGSGWQVMNEVTLHRGRSPHLNVIDAFVDGQYLTEAVSDGLILSTPTGSTAYSLSSGGPIVHPAMEALLLTPICPRSLSFRPLVLPGQSMVALRINERSRMPVEVSMDGQAALLIGPGQCVKVGISPYPVPCVNRSYSSSEEDGVAADDWVRDINTLLQFNVSFRNKSLLDPTM